MKYRVKYRVLGPDQVKRKYAINLEEGAIFPLTHELLAGQSEVPGDFNPVVLELHLRDEVLVVVQADPRLVPRIGNQSESEFTIRAGDLVEIDEFGIEFLEVPMPVEPERDATQFLDAAEVNKALNRSKILSHGNAPKNQEGTEPKGHPEREPEARPEYRSEIRVEAPNNYWTKSPEPGAHRAQPARPSQTDPNVAKGPGREQAKSSSTGSPHLERATQPSATQPSRKNLNSAEPATGAPRAVPTAPASVTRNSSRHTSPHPSRSLSPKPPVQSERPQAQASRSRGASHPDRPAQASAPERSRIAQRGGNHALAASFEPETALLDEEEVQDSQEDVESATTDAPLAEVVHMPKRGTLGRPGRSTPSRPDPRQEETVDDEESESAAPIEDPSLDEVPYGQPTLAKYAPDYIPNVEERPLGQPIPTNAHEPTVLGPRKQEKSKSSAKASPSMGSRLPLSVPSVLSREKTLSRLMAPNVKDVSSTMRDVTLAGAAAARVPRREDAHGVEPMSEAEHADLADLEESGSPDFYESDDYEDPSEPFKSPVEKALRLPDSQRALKPFTPHEAGAEEELPPGDSLKDLGISLGIAVVGAEGFARLATLNTSIEPSFFGKTTGPGSLYALALGAVVLGAGVAFCARLGNRLLSTEGTFAEYSRFTAWGLFASMPCAIALSLPPAKTMVAFAVLSLLWILVFARKFKPNPGMFSAVISLCFLAFGAGAYRFFPETFRDVITIAHMPEGATGEASPEPSPIHKPVEANPEAPHSVPPAPPVAAIAIAPVTPAPAMQRPLPPDPRVVKEYFSAVREGTLSVVRSEIEKKRVTTQLTLGGGQTALMLASAFGRRSVAEYLIEQGADMNAQDQEGGTALMWAVARRHPECVRLLLTHGANPDARRKTGERAIDLARKSQQLDLIEMLEHTRHGSR